jgi:hypothetical protein
MPTFPDLLLQSGRGSSSRANRAAFGEARRQPRSVPARWQSGPPRSEVHRPRQVREQVRGGARLGHPPSRSHVFDTCATGLPVLCLRSTKQGGRRFAECPLRRIEPLGAAFVACIREHWVVAVDTTAISLVARIGSRLHIFQEERAKTRSWHGSCAGRRNCTARPASAAAAGTRCALDAAPGQASRRSWPSVDPGPLLSRGQGLRAARLGAAPPQSPTRR